MVGIDHRRGCRPAPRRPAPRPPGRRKEGLGRCGPWAARPGRRQHAGRDRDPARPGPQDPDHGVASAAASSPCRLAEEARVGEPAQGRRAPGEASLPGAGHPEAFPAPGLQPTGSTSTGSGPTARTGSQGTTATGSTLKRGCVYAPQQSSTRKTSDCSQSPPLTSMSSPETWSTATHSCETSTETNGRWRVSRLLTVVECCACSLNFPVAGSREPSTEVQVRAWAHG